VTVRTRWAVLIGVSLYLVGCLGIAGAQQTSTAAAGLRPLGLDEMRAVTGQMMRQKQWCVDRGWWPCQGSNGCYWHPGAQQCRADVAQAVPACREAPDEDYQCKILDGPNDWVCCIEIMLCNGAAPEECNTPGGHLGWNGCDYRTCQTWYQGQPG